VADLGGIQDQQEQCRQLRHKITELESVEGQDVNVPAVINQSLESQKDRTPHQK